jgi:cytochrome P450
MCSFLTANRDPEVWHDPDSFVTRCFADPDGSRLLSFGGGPHHRMTLEEVVHGVASLAPKLTADPNESSESSRSGAARRGFPWRSDG